MERVENDSPSYQGVADAQRQNSAAFHSKFIQCFETGLFADVYITCRDAWTFKCHREILAAASDYFEEVFTGSKEESREEKIDLPFVDGATFEIVVQMAHKRSVIVNGENVYSLLCASDQLGMKTLETLCSRYLTEREVPKKYALQIFTFACTAGKNSLIPLVSRFILHHLDHFERDERGLTSISLDHMKELLTFWRPSSAKREHLLLKVLKHWVSHSTVSEEQLLAEFTCLIRIEHTDISGDYNSLSFQETGDINSAVAPKLPLAVENDPSKRLSLHMYTYLSRLNACDLLTLKSSENCVEWDSPIEVEGAEIDMRTVAVDNRLYSYSLQRGGAVAFNVYSSVRLSDKQSLSTPIDLVEDSHMVYNPGDFDTVGICSDPISSRVFLYHNFTSRKTTTNLFTYNCEIDKWFPIYRNGNLKVSSITFCDGLLYAIGLENKIVEAYDYRAGRWEVLASTDWFHGEYDKSCPHKDKIFVSSKLGRQTLLEVYYPVADKWRTLSSSPASSFSSVGWLISFANKLWLFGENSESIFADISLEEYYYNVQRYDSFLKKWDTECSLLEDRSKSVIDIIVFGSD